MWRLSWLTVARCACDRASIGRRSPMCWPCWRCDRAESAGVGADLRVPGADGHAKEFRLVGGLGAGGIGIRSALRPSVRVPQSPWRSDQVVVVGPRRIDALLSAAGRRNLSLPGEQRSRRAKHRGFVARIIAGPLGHRSGQREATERVISARLDAREKSFYRRRE